VPATADPTYDLTQETLLSLAQAARRFPPYRQGRPVSPSCLWRWCFDGVKVPGGGVVKLEAVRVSGRWLTSLEALSRFVARQTPSLENESAKETPRAAGKRQRAAERAGEQLSSIGI
jgi:Protein of unknown function (DUF1580)